MVPRRTHNIHPFRVHIRLRPAHMHQDIELCRLYIMKKEVLKVCDGPGGDHRSTRETTEDFLRTDDYRERFNSFFTPASRVLQRNRSVTVDLYAFLESEPYSDTGIGTLLPRKILAKLAFKAFT